MAQDEKYIPTWKKELNKVTNCPQRQDSTVDQCRDLIQIANKFGFYDAADLLKQIVTQNGKG